MHNCRDESLVNRWFPVALSSDLPKRHVFHAMLLGEELAIWRADGGAVNAWENRCPHRGVRLSIGQNLGNELRCRYHGMQFASESGQCTFMPAHRDAAPARALCAKVYGCREQDEFVWVSLGCAAFDGTPFAGGNGVPLRSLPINASALLVADALMDYRFNPDPDGAPDETIVEPIDAFTLRATNGGDTVLFGLQPVDTDCAVVHGAVIGPVVAAHRIALLRHHNQNLSELRRTIEAAGKRVLSLSGGAARNAYRGLIGERTRYGLALQGN